jgi:hypothetical protein
MTISINIWLFCLLVLLSAVLGESFGYRAGQQHAGVLDKVRWL